jgi:glyoxylase-like metal-dependent hydrolase (beta-lactamase superfamily II)
VGNTQQDPARFASLYGDVSTKLFGRLPDATWVYPGHGGDTTLGAERPTWKSGAPGAGKCGHALVFGSPRIS